MFRNVELNNLIAKYREKKLSHAYLIETNNIDQALEDIKTLIKNINCPEEYEINCTKCNLCKLFSKESIPSLKIIEPNGTSIKKEQIEELKERFATIPVYSKYNVYIIKNAEKLNPSSANSMLKFLEEPTEGIIGFFLTNNKDIIMDTIKSRCSILVLNYETKSILEKLKITQEEYDDYINTIKDYLNKIDNHKIINHKKEILAIYPERKQIENIFKIIFEVFYQKLLKTNNLNYEENLEQIYSKEISLNNLIKKLNNISTILQDMSYNVNIELILDRFVIEMRGRNE